VRDLNSGHRECPRPDGALQRKVSEINGVDIDGRVAAPSTARRKQVVRFSFNSRNVSCYASIYPVDPDQCTGCDAMGHRASLVKQASDALVSKCAFGMSRHEAKKNGTDAELIFSHDTLKTYLKADIRFVKYCKEKHDCKYLEECRQYVPEYVALRKKALSPSSIKMEVSALAKLFGITGTGGRDKNGRYKSPWGVELPERNRDDFTRSRGGKIRDKGFSEKKNAALVTFCRCIGPRHYKELTRMRGTDLRKIDEEFYVKIVGKGGRVRLVPICGTDDEIKAVVDQMKAAGSEKVWPAIPSHADIHSYRSDYAMRLYRQHARSEDELKGKSWWNPARKRWERADFIFRKGKLKGIVIDKAAALLAAEALGHCRIDVFCNNYFRM